MNARSARSRPAGAARTARPAAKARSAAKPRAQPAAARDSEALQRIWRAVAALPRGRVTTYGVVAASAGLVRRARLVGYALRHAPPELKLPWHRVVAAGGRIALPPRSAAYREQVRLLAREGVTVVRGRAQLPPEDDLDALLWGHSR